ncbi:MAG: hypothetical protein CVV64_14925 [Candidatus Wallbacteria bacterium HGW-Wallbacteria-1]|jgi:hypothetical protein|uniref:Uncharacterized protein n=1 Tax=Candidatus Wallbacteria bacterium HGW-Wallbacteria-1 TaxID=2013854 RepID=A0A2N1PLX6_9BACT|nr:MAG: hypothetical protein CVV64_14925 [Candidatus Wallbacteria bacterium HGW-Wallbacteria-1]
MIQEAVTDSGADLNQGVKLKFRRMVLGLLAALVLFCFPGFRIPVMDDAADRYFSDAITKAGVAYGTCRVLNASVSFLKESDIELQPAGIGISLALGQILDPIDDMTERLSDVLVTAMTSLGVQKLVHEICLSLVARILAFLLLAATVLSMFCNARLVALHELSLRLILLMIILRICFPASSMVNDYLYENFFAQRIQEANEGLRLGFTEQDYQDLTISDNEGIIGTFTKGASYLREKTRQFSASFQEFMKNSASIIENLLRLTYLYVGLFVIQVLLIPLVSFWVLMKGVNSIFGIKSDLNGGQGGNCAVTGQSVKISEVENG